MCNFLNLNNVSDMIFECLEITATSVDPRSIHKSFEVVMNV